MPAVVPFIAAGISAAGAAIAGVGVSGLISAAVGVAVNFVVSGLLSKKPEDPGNRALPLNRSQMIQMTDSPRQLVYGRNQKSGSLAFQYTSSDNQYFYMAIVLASHSCEEIESIFVGEDELVVSSDLDTDTDYTTNGITHYKAGAATDYADNLWVDIALGSSSSNANSRFVAETSSTFSGTDYLRDTCVVYTKMKWDDQVYGGRPNIKVTMKGKSDIYDYRTSSTAYTVNPALCVTDYMVNSVLGLGLDDTTELDVASVVAAANVCDEDVALAAGGTEDRYTCNGIIDSTTRIGDGMQSIIGAMAGSVIYVNGQFRVLAGEYRTPTLTITEDDIISDLSLSRPGKRDKFNAVRGLYVSEEEDFTPTDFPHVTNSTYATEDGETIFKDLQMAFTISSPSAQRIAKIDLERNRQDLMVNMVVNLRKWDVAAGDTIMVTYDPWGWSSKVFDVLERNLIIVEEDTLAVALSLRETATSVYAWSAEETEVDPAPNTNLPSVFKVSPLTGLALDSSEAQLLRGRNGRIVTRIKVSWDPIADVFVKDSGKIEIQYKKTTASVWDDATPVSGNATVGYIFDVDDRDSYNVRIRAINTVNSKSAYLEAPVHVVIGKTTPPPNITGFIAAENLGSVLFTWDQLTILDVYGYEIRYGPSGVQWKDAIPLTKAKQGTSEATILVPPGTWSFLIKAIDYVGLYSLSPAVRGPIFISNINSVLDSVADGDFPGTLDNMVKHYTNVLVPASQNLASADDFDTFDIFVPNPEKICTYTSEEIDLGSDTDIRVWGEIVSELGPGVTEGTADPKMQLTYRSEADSSSIVNASVLDLIADAGTYVNCFKHYTDVVIPDSQSLANATSAFEVFDNFVYNPYESCSYESEEQDIGADSNVQFVIDQSMALGPGQSGTPESTLKFDSRNTGESYDGFEAFIIQPYNLRYFKFKMEWGNISNSSYLSKLDVLVDGWNNWIIGYLNDVRYVQARIRLDTDVGIAKITDFNWTIDETI